MYLLTGYVLILQAVFALRPTPYGSTPYGHKEVCTYE